MWIRIALLLLWCPKERTTAASTIIESTLTSTTSSSTITSSTLLPTTDSKTFLSTTDSKTYLSTTDSTTFLSTNAPTIPSTIFSHTASVTNLTSKGNTPEQSSNINYTTIFTSNHSTEATDSTNSERSGLTSTITTSQSKLTINESLSLTSKNPGDGTSLESTATTALHTTTISKETSYTSQSSHANSLDPLANSPGEKSNKLGVILPAAIVPVVICSTVAILVFVYMRRSKRKMTGVPDKKVTSKSIDILEFDNVLRDMNANSQLKFSEEFMALATVGKEYSKDVAGQETNREKNRYTDIKPYDISRVKLSINPEDESDYINASWIPGYFSRRQYIAAQGPMPSTQDDFWRMVWEYNSRIIVMLTKTVESNRIKCCQYWPANREVVMYGDIAVSIIDETEGDAWITREMNVSMGQQKRLVKQCFFTKWPDMKTPEDSSSIIDFIRMVRSYCPIRGSSPLVVHCSAGVGRTGAFIALDTAMYQIEEEEKVDIFGIVYKMRLNRVSMVQNERQYIFIYETVADLIRNYQEEKKKKSNGQADFFMGDLPKSDTISDNLTYQNIDASNSALVINEDVRNLL